MRETCWGKAGQLGKIYLWNSKYKSPMNFFLQVKKNPMNIKKYKH